MLINNTKTQTKCESSAFTLVEVLVIMPIVILVIGGLISAIIIMTGNVLATRNDNALVYDIQNALDTIETDVKISGGFLPTNALNKSDGSADAIQAPQGKGNSDTAFTASNDTLILKTFATTASPSTSSSQIVYTGDETQCTNNTATTININIVYFVSGGTLWRRTILPSDYLLSVKCNGATVWQRPSCSADKISDYSSICKVKDTKLVSGVTKFELKYYNSNNDEKTDYTNLTSATNDYVTINIEASGKAAGRSYTESGTIRATVINNY